MGSMHGTLYAVLLLGGELLAERCCSLLTSGFQVSLSLDFLNAVWTPKFWG